MTLFGWIVRIGVGLVALLLLLLVAAWWFTRPGSPGGFYAAPASIPDEPGRLLKAEPFERGVPGGAQAWRILYTTTRGDGSPALASGIVVAKGRAASPRPVILWAHGTTGIEPGCGRSLLKDPFQFVAAMDQLLEEGWAYVASDHIGLGAGEAHPYLMGPDEARGELDAVRAARQIQGLSLDDRTVVWGHSQGGHAALWTAIEAPSYAPDVPISGVAAIAPASDLPELVQRSMNTPFGKLVLSYITVAYSRTYPDVSFDAYVQPGARWLVQDMASRCTAGLETLFSIAEGGLLSGKSMFATSPVEGAFGERLRANSADRDIAVPVMVLQGANDDIVWPDIQAAYVQRRCAVGQAIDYRTYPDRDHISVVAPDSPLTADIMEWTRARFAGEPVAQSCTTNPDGSGPPLPFRHAQSTNVF